MKKTGDLFASSAATVKAAVFLVMIASMVPVALLQKRFDPRQPFKVPQIFHGLVLRLLGIRVRVSGAASMASPLLFVANHTSYLDVIVLGALLPAAFVAKSEVAGWPLFGFLAKVQNTVFIERRSARAADQRTQLQECLAKGQNLILFPEGTSSDGMEVLPFKSSLFSIVEDSAQDSAITVQPVSLACTELNGFPLLREERPLYAWYGDMTLMPHLWNVFKRGRFTIDVRFHQPLRMADCPNRKALAMACQEQVARGIEQSLTGRGLLPTQEKGLPPLADTTL